MPIDPKQERYVQRFFPGLIDAIRALGDGDFEPALPKLNCSGPSAIRGIALTLKYKFDDRLELEIRVQLRLLAGKTPYEPSEAPVDLRDWETYRYALNYGPSFAPCYFRFDRDAISGDHVHMEPTPNDHVPAEKVEPNTSDMDPRAFVELVAQYRRDSIYPLRRKKP